MEPMLETRPATFSDFTIPIVLAGIGGGVLSTIPCISVCCFLWVPLAGGLAVWMTLKAKPEQPQLLSSAGQVAMVGAAVGFVSSAVYGIGSFLLSVLLGGAMASMESSSLSRLGGEQVGAMMAGSFIGSVIGWLFAAVAFTVFAAVGAFATAQISFKNSLR